MMNMWSTPITVRHWVAGSATRRVDQAGCTPSPGTWGGWLVIGEVGGYRRPGKQLPVDAADNRVRRRLNAANVEELVGISGERRSELMEDLQPVLEFVHVEIRVVWVALPEPD